MKKDKERWRPELWPENEEKLIKIAHDLNISRTEALNRILASVTSIDMKALVTFKLEVRYDPNIAGRNVPFRRTQSWSTKI